MRYVGFGIIKWVIALHEDRREMCAFGEAVGPGVVQILKP